MTTVTRNVFVSCGGRLILAAAFCVASFLLQPTAYLRAQGQASFASLNGTVRDQTGAVVPGSTVTVSNSERNFSRTFTTGNDGGYVFTLLPPMTYTLKVAAPGFQAYTQSGIVLAVAQAATQDVALTLGQVTQQVTVTAGAALLDTNNANTGSEVTGRETVELPLSVHNPFYLVTINSSVNVNPTAVGGDPGIRDADATWFNFGGSYVGKTAFLLDGHWDSGLDWAGIVFAPPTEETQEFKVQTNTYTAQYGLSMGNVVNVITKSGTRDVHGEMHEFLRNSDMDANNFFNNSEGIPRPAFRRNQFGGTIGGPLYIPKLYQQRDKTFIFGGYEGLRQSTPVTLLTTIPTASMRTGDFSALLGSQIGTDALGRPTLTGQLYNPFTTRTITKGAVDPNTGLVASQSGYIRDPFVGNVIPAGLINPSSKLIEAFYPNPTNAALTNNFAASLPFIGSIDRFSVRVDVNISEKARFFARYSQARERTTATPPWYGTSDIGGPGFTFGDPRTDVGVGYSRTFSPTFVMSVSLGENRWIEARYPQGTPFSPSTLGLPSALDTLRNFFPYITIDGAYGFGTYYGWTWGGQNEDTVAVDFTKIHGQHTFNFGYQFIRGRDAELIDYPTEFNFPVGMTQGADPTLANPNTGYGLASFLLGTGNTGGLPLTPFTAFRRMYHGWYFEDQWKMTPKLTASLGVRYDYQGAPSDRFNRAPTFDFNAANPLQAELAKASGGTAPFPVRGQLVYPTSGYHGVYDRVWSNIAPRVSGTYRITSKLVARAGFGMFYLPSISPGDYEGLSLTGYSQTTPYVGTVDGITPMNLLSNPFPNGILLPVGNSLGGLTYVGQAPDATNRRRPSPYIENWTYGTQYGLGSSTVIDVTYMGNHGVKLPFPYPFQLDQLPTQDLSFGTSLLQSVPNPFYGYITSSSCGLDQPTVLRGQLLRPYPEYCGLNGDQPPGAFSSYNAVTFTFNRRWSRGLQFLASYTISKFLDDALSGQGWATLSPTAASCRNYYDTAAEKALNTNDIPQSLVLSYIYQLPVGRGRHFGTSLNKVADGVVGGWQVSGISSFKSGFPLGIVAQTNNTNSFGGTQNPNLVGNPNARPAGVSRIQEWFNTAAFTQPDPFTFGNSPRSLPSTRADGINDFDISLSKSFQMGERWKLQLRGDFFNAFNRPYFIVPNQVYGSPTFGQVSAAGVPRDIQLGLKLSF
jgi:hypothetical protein